MSDTNLTNDNNDTEGKIDPELRGLLEVLESWSELRPYFDPDFKILIIEESEVPIMIMNRKVFKELESKIIGEA